MRAALPFLVVFLAGCLVPSGSGPSGPTTPAFQFGFDETIVVDLAGAGSEPGLLAARDGALYVVSVLGSATRRGDGLWKSTDGGATWQSLGLPDYPFGGGDADLAEDDAGTIYLPGQWRPAATPPADPTDSLPGCYITTGESMAVSKDQGRTWTVNPIASDAPIVDRQWVATYKTGIVYLAFNQAQRGLVVTKSTDSGLTWTQLNAVPDTYEAGGGLGCGGLPDSPLTQGGPNGIPGNILVDPTDGTLLIPYAPGIGTAGHAHRLFTSKDGVAFQTHVIHTAPSGVQPSAIFGSLGRDIAGHLYYAWAEETAGAPRVYFATSNDDGASWSAPRLVTRAEQSAVFPWLTVGAPGRVAIAYYAANGTFLSDEAPAEAEWYPTITMLPEALDGTAGAETHRLSQAPNHRGPLCTGGTGCDPQYRRLGDFFEIGLTPAGSVAAVWADDLQSSGKTLNVFARQSLGSLL